MADMILESGIVIDDEAAVLKRMSSLSGKIITDLGIVKKFIQSEKNTRIYVDRSLHSYMQNEPGCTYLWIDTGFVDLNGQAILISLLKNGDEYVGHIVGSIRELANRAVQFFKLKKKDAARKIVALEEKYKQKAAERRTAHIGNQEEYLLGKVNDDTGNTTLAGKIKALNCTFPEDEAETIVLEPEEVTQEEDNKIVHVDAFSHFSESQQQITIDILLEQMEKMQGTIDLLYREVQRLKDNTAEKELEMTNMTATIEEYRRALVLARDFSRSESDKEEAKEKVLADTRPGHMLIRNRGKILIIGGEKLGRTVMDAIAKQYGFEKCDLVYMGYHEAKNCADQIRREGRYAAVIFGACPHKTSGNDGYGSLLEKLMNTEGMPYTVDARSKAGVLKITKESFRGALADVCAKFRDGDSCFRGMVAI